VILRRLLKIAELIDFQLNELKMKQKDRGCGAKLTVIDEKDISEELDIAIRDGLVECFPPDAEYFSRQSWWHSGPAWRVLAVDDDDRVIGHVAVVVRTVSAGPNRVSVRSAGIQSVFVRPEYRGKGLSDKIMAQAMAEAKRRQLDAGLLFCVPKYEPVYERMGWTRINANVLMRNEEGKAVPIPGENIAMVYPLNEKEFPIGEIDLGGPDW
jgi:predicted N-acetyltransferase YhbS